MSIKKLLSCIILNIISICYLNSMDFYNLNLNLNYLEQINGKAAYKPLNVWYIAQTSPSIVENLSKEIAQAVNAKISELNKKDAFKEEGQKKGSPMPPINEELVKKNNLNLDADFFTNQLTAGQTVPAQGRKLFLLINGVNGLSAANYARSTIENVMSKFLPQTDTDKEVDDFFTNSLKKFAYNYHELILQDRNVFLNRLDSAILEYSSYTKFSGYTDLHGFLFPYVRKDKNIETEDAIYQLNKSSTLGILACYLAQNIIYVSVLAYQNLNSKMFIIKENGNYIDYSQVIYENLKTGRIPDHPISNGDRFILMANQELWKPNTKERYKEIINIILKNKSDIAKSAKELIDSTRKQNSYGQIVFILIDLRSDLEVIIPAPKDVKKILAPIEKPKNLGDLTPEEAKLVIALKDRNLNRIYTREGDTNIFVFTNRNGEKEFFKPSLPGVQDAGIVNLKKGEMMILGGSFMPILKETGKKTGQE